MIRLWHENGQGGDGADLVLGGFVQPQVHQRIIAFICANAPEVFVSRISSLTWLRNDPQLIRVMLPVSTRAPSERCTTSSWR